MRVCCALGGDNKGGRLETMKEQGRPEECITTLLLPYFSLLLPTRLRAALFP